MTQIAIAPRVSAVRNPYASGSARIHLSDPERRNDGDRGMSMLGVAPKRSTAQSFTVEQPEPAPKPVVGETLEKVVRRIPTLYVIALFGVVVLCAVLMIWNTLQVNKLTLERTRNDERIAQTEQRLIKLRAREMQLSQPSVIRELAQMKFGMIEESGEDLVIVR